MNMNNDQDQKIVLYQSKDGELALDVTFEGETVWLSQKQMAELFGVGRQAITKHLLNIFKADELEKNSACSILEHTANDGKKYKTKFYNLDAIISVGYRVNSSQATQFRIWATKILKDHLIKGYSLNEKRLQEKGFDEFEKAISLIKQTLDKKELTTDEATGLLKVITDYANSWLLLQKYDEATLTTPKEKVHSEYVLDSEEALKSIAELKQTLMAKKEASELFGQEREPLSGILGNIYQTFGEEDLYESIEEKSAHILYFIIKDHPFVDGNKRIGSFLFILFLAKHNYLTDSNGERKFNDNALVALALLIAESDPKQKDLIIKLIMNFVRGE